MVRFVIAVALCLLLFRSEAIAGDNLTCAAPFGAVAANSALPSNSDSVATTTKEIAPNQGTPICVDISNSLFVERMDCFVMQSKPNAQHPAYRCELAKSCSTGVFSDPTRHYSEKAGFDTVCVTYKSESGGTVALAVETR